MSCSLNTIIELTIIKFFEKKELFNFTSILLIWMNDAKKAYEIIVVAKCWKEDVKTNQKKS